jgi:hypothetical protein
MINRTIAVALLAGLASPVLAGAFPSPALEQVTGMSNGSKSANNTYDGSLTQTPVQAQTAGSISNAAPAEAPAVTTPSRQALAADVPAPPKAAAKGSFIKNLINKRSLMMGAGGAVVGGGVGFLLGGPLGAAIGAIGGFLIGLVLSKVLHKKH